MVLLREIYGLQKLPCLRPLTLLLDAMREFISLSSKVYVGLDELSGHPLLRYGRKLWKNWIISLARTITSISFVENLGYLDKEMQMNTMDLYITIGR